MTIRCAITGWLWNSSKLVWFCCLGLIATAHAGPNGLYVLIPKDTAPAQATLDATHVSGLQIRATWGAIEGTQNVYDWTYFDARVAEAATQQKHVTLGIVRGLVDDGLPAWITAPTYSLFDCDLPGGDGGQAPVYWDGPYLREWIEVNRLMVERYRATPVVAGFRIQIYMWLDLDWGDCTNQEASIIQAWITAGYTRAKLQQAWRSYLHALHGVTDKPLLLPIANTMDESTGTKTTDASRSVILDPMAQILQGIPRARVRLPRNLTAWRVPAQTPRLTYIKSPQAWFGRTVFQPTTADPLQVWNAETPGSQFAELLARRPFVWGQRQGPALGGPCQDDTEACFEEQLHTADIALHYGVQLFEIGESMAGISRFVPVWTCMNQAMRRGGGHCGH